MSQSAKPSGFSRELFLKLAISLFVIVYAGLTLAFLCPAGNALRDTITGTTKSAWNFLGFQQSWSLFSPKIRVTNTHCIALVTFKDGTTTQWPLPRFEYANYYQKFRGDKFRKWAGDNAPWSNYKEFWPDMARYIGRIHYSSQNPPVSLMMTLYMSNTPKPEEKRNRLDMPFRTQFHSYYLYRFKPEDFKV